MVIRLLPEQIPHYWNLVKHGALTVNRPGDEKRIEEYCKNLLKNLLSEQFQAWIGINDETKGINGVAITAIRKDIGDIPYLLIETVYGFATSPLDDINSFADHMREFAKNVRCSSIMAYVSNPRVAAAAERIGMKKTSEIYCMTIGKEA